MDIFSTIFNIPILQAVGVVLLIGLAERMGIPIISALKGLMKLDNTSRKDVIADNHEVVQPLLSEMENLTTHYNHEVTGLLTDIKNKLGDVHDCLKKANNRLEEFDKYGIKTREK